MYYPSQDKDEDYVAPQHKKKNKVNRDPAMAVLMDAGVLASSQKPSKRRKGNQQHNKKSTYNPDWD